MHGAGAYSLENINWRMAVGHSKIDLIVTVGDETFNLLEVPESNSTLVKNRKDLILGGVDH